MCNRNKRRAIKRQRLAAKSKRIAIASLASDKDAQRTKQATLALNNAPARNFYRGTLSPAYSGMNGPRANIR